VKKIGLLSDTHGYLDNKMLKYFDECDEIWHAGDIGTIEVADRLAAFKPLKAVYGNIDGAEIRKVHPLHQRFFCEQVDVWITHIGGYPGRYDNRIKEALKIRAPKLFITGHSHILKVMPDKKLNNMLHLNPGAAGKSGFHKVRTMVRFQIDGDRIEKLEVIELGKK